MRKASTRKDDAARRRMAALRAHYNAYAVARWAYDEACMAARRVFNEACAAADQEKDKQTAPNDDQT